MTDQQHPALYPASTQTHTRGLGDHFVPDGWEEIEKGICPCGVVVQWDRFTETWQEWPEAYVLIVPERGFSLLDTSDQMDLQESLREEA